MAPQLSRSANSKPSARRRQPATFAGLRCERLEDRLAPALFNALTPYTNTSLSNNGCVATADLNKDGLMDVILTNFGTGYGGSIDVGTPGETITLLYGRASGGFNTLTLNTQGKNVSFVSVADINGDTWPDLVASNGNQQNTGSVSVFKNDGAGNMSLVGAPFSTQGNNASWVGLADVTGDGILDAVVCNFGRQVGGESKEGNKITVFQGNSDGQGHGNFTFAATTYAELTHQTEGIDDMIPVAAALADFDGDGFIDIVGLSQNIPGEIGARPIEGMVAIYKGSASGFQATPNITIDTTGVLSTNIQVGDLNGDGKPDLVVTNAGDPGAALDFQWSNASVDVLLNTSSTGNLSFGFPDPLQSNIRGPFASAIADFNLDGKADIAAINYGAPTGASNPVHAFVSVFLGNGQGGFSPDTTTYDTNTGEAGGQYLAVGDFDRNGTPDLVTSHDNDKVGQLTNLSTPPVAAATSLTISGVPTNATAGQSFTVTVTARDQQGAVFPGYTGTVHFTSNDSQALLPPDYTFLASDNGVKTFTITLKTSGSHSFTVTDLATASLTDTKSTNVIAAAAATIQLTGPSTVVAGTPQQFTVTAKDAFGNTATGYRGMIHFTSSDPLATLPSNYTFTAGDNGVHSFPITLATTTGPQSVTATDTVTATLTDTKSGITVTQPNDTTPPTVTTKTPLPGATDVATTTTITAIFSEAVQSGTISLVVKDSNNTTITGTLSYDPATLTVTFTPTATLTPGMTFTVTVSGAQDLAGNTMANVVWSFTTQTVAPPPPTEKYSIAAAGKVTQFNPDGSIWITKWPFGPNYKWAVRIVTGDVTGDGVEDIIATAPGRGVREARVRVINGATGAILAPATLRVPGYKGVLTAAVGDLTGDGIDDVVLGANQSGPRVLVFQGGSFSRVTAFRAIPSPTGFMGRTQVAVADVNGDERDDLVVSALYTNGTRVTGFTGESLGAGVVREPAFTRFVLTGGYMKGSFLAAGDVNGDGNADLILGSAAGTAARVEVFSGKDLTQASSRVKIASFVPTGASRTTGVRVGMRDVNGDGVGDLLTSSGDFLSGFEGGASLPATGLPTALFNPFDPDLNFAGAVWVG